jgi:outer membrane biosynthesis protein TonB
MNSFYAGDFKASLLYPFLDVQPPTPFKGNRMRNVKLNTLLTRSIHLAVTALFVLSLAPMAWSDDTAAPPATTEMPGEGVPPAPSADPGMGAPQEAAPPAAEEPPPPVHKKKKKAKKAAKSKKHSKKKSSSGKKKKKKKKHHNY